MVATWNIAADAGYYAAQAESQASYYVGGREPAGVWYAPAGDFDIEDGAEVEPALFERLHAGLGADGQVLIAGNAKGRVPAYDFTFSAPRSATLAWAFADPILKAKIEAAQLRAVRAALHLLEQEATFARRGHNGQTLESVPLTAALFQHGESRPAEHADGQIFADPNLHTHAVVPNIATRADGSVGALFSVAHRDLKLAVGATYHAEFSAALIEIGFRIDRIGRNGIFEIAGTDDALIDYFSARRQEIEGELVKHGVSSAEAVALASSIARTTRQAKDEAAFEDRETTWKQAAARLGVDLTAIVEGLLRQEPVHDAEQAEQLLAERLAGLPAHLTAQRSVFERKDLIAAVATALVGTGLPASRISAEIDQLIEQAAVIEIGRNRLGHARYTTPEILAAERHLADAAIRLVAREGFHLDADRIAAQSKDAGLSAEQSGAALIATQASALAVIAGAPGSGKTTTLSTIVSAYRDAGHRVIGAASAWRVANSLSTELGIEARATASWLEGARHGHDFLQENDVLVVDEAGLIDLRDMNALLDHVEQAGAKIILVGDTKQLQPIGGPALSLVERSVEVARVEQIVRQHEPWSRDAIRDFGQGKAGAALDAFAGHGRLVEAAGLSATIGAAVDTWKRQRQPGEAPLLLARSNAAAMALSRSVREVLHEDGVLSGPDIAIPTVTPSGQTTSIALARGDQIRFLSRNDHLGVINGTTGRIAAVHQRGGEDPLDIEVEANVEGRTVNFLLSEIADSEGRARLTWAYASTIYQAQGATVERAVVLVDGNFDRHQIYVAASRARQQTTLVFDARAIDRQLAGELPVGQTQKDGAFEPEVRRAWLAQRLSRTSTKESALEVQSAAGGEASKDKTREGKVEKQAERRGREPARTREASLD